MSFKNITIFMLAAGAVYWGARNSELAEMKAIKDLPIQMSETVKQNLSHPLFIETMRDKAYPGSDLVTEKTLPPGSNYGRYIASYQSDGHKIYGLLTIPRDTKPEGGWPVIIFNHGYIPPQEYRTEEKYVAYQDGFARNGYITFKSDYRGHGDSEGEPEGAYGSNGYTTDVLNAVASIRKMPDANAEKIGMWGHSMGGYLTLRAMVAEQNIKAAVIWAGVVGSYPDLLNSWNRRNFTPPPQLQNNARRWRDTFVQTYGTPEQNSSFWSAISANSYLADLSGPVQIHHGSGDETVPMEFSQILDKQIKEAGKESELFIYQGDNHNLSNNFTLAMKRSVEFFDKYLK